MSSGRALLVENPLTGQARKSPIRHVRTLFVSDVHLGCKHSQAAALLELLERIQPQQLYLVGDFIDGWKLKRRWHWLPVYDQLLRRLLALKRRGTRLFYTPGNHDAFLRPFLANFGVVEIRDRFVHVTADQRRFLVMHGDQFDRIEQQTPWLSILGMHAYDWLLRFNRMANRLLRRRPNCFALSGAVKRRVKSLVRHFSDFELRLIEAARQERCDGIICGHIHAPRIIAGDELIYCNTGDWVENCTALVEHDDGSLELIHHDDSLIDWLPARELRANSAFEDDVYDPLPWGDAAGEEEEPLFYPSGSVLVA